MLPDQVLRVQASWGARLGGLGVLEFVVLVGDWEVGRARRVGRRRVVVGFILVVVVVVVLRWWVVVLFI